MRPTKSLTIVSGHRNPDIDSIAAACALAELRRLQGEENIEPICPGTMSEKARYLFKKFDLKTPPIYTDLFPKIRDIMDTAPPVVMAGTPLLEAMRQLRKTRFSQLPVITKDKQFLGMLSPLALLSNLVQIGDNSNHTSFTGRRVFSSLSLIVEVLAAEALNLHEPDLEQYFDVYVAAMSLDCFDGQLKDKSTKNIAIIVGDRPDIHLMALNLGIRLLIVTGGRAVDPTILKEAKNREVCIIQTKFDSATVIRRLKFSTPVEKSDLTQEATPLSPQTRLRDVRKKLYAAFEDIFPVQNSAGKLLGIVHKKDLDCSQPYKLIMVDHNELEQSLPGANETPVIEVVDHHRMGMNATLEPIKITCDIVGSTCTLITEMFRQQSLTPNKKIAGLLLGGVVSDTLLLRSPTTTPRDHEALIWLEHLTGANGEDLMNELMSVGSLMGSKSAEEILRADRKDYYHEGIKFAVAQVEENNFAELHVRAAELLESLHQQKEKDNLDFIGLLVTDIVRENSELLAAGTNKIMNLLPYKPVAENMFSLPGVLSRKKQLLPQLLATFAELEQ